MLLPIPHHGARVSGRDGSVLGGAARRWVTVTLFATFFSACLTAITVAKYGWGLHPEWSRFLDGALHSPDLGASRLSEGDGALLSNATLSLIAWVSHSTTETRFIVLALMTTVAALCAPIWMAARRRDSVLMVLLFFVVAGGSLAHVLLMWVGGYDAPVVLALTVGAMTRRSTIVVLSWALAGFTHSSVAFVALAFWAIMILTDHGRPRDGRARLLGYGVAGAVAGWLIIRVLTDAWGGSTDRLALFHAIPFEGILECYTRALPLILISGLGATWLVFLIRPLWDAQPTKVFLVVAGIATLTLPLIAVDETRIIALSLVPATLAWAVQTTPLLDPGALRRPMWRIGWVAILLPVPVVWMGTPYFTSWPIGG